MKIYALEKENNLLMVDHSLLKIEKVMMDEIKKSKECNFLLSTWENGICINKYIGKDAKRFFAL